MSTFTFTPSYSVVSRNQPSVRQVRFGDGYEQRASFGINTNPRTFELQFNGKTKSEANAIEQFFTDRGAVQSFDWTPEYGNAGKFVCRSWSRALVDKDIYNISCTFDEVFES